MKKLFTHLMLLIALLLCSSSSWAQLKICGHSVDLSATSTQTITGSGISGTVTYNASRKELTLENATLTSSGNNDGIYNQSVDGLSILFKGTVTINVNSTGNNVAALYTDKNLTLTSPGAAAPPVITLRNTGAGPAFKVRGATVTAWGDNITATAANNNAVVGEVFNSGTKPSLIFHFSSLSATGASDFKALTGFTGGLSLYISVHSGGTSFDSASGAIVNSSNSAVQEAVILPALTLGKLYIGAAGERSINTSSTGASTASGKFEYSSSAKTLTLTDLNVDGAGLVSRIPGLKIDFKGGGKLINSAIAMDLYGDTELTSDGTVVITGTNSSAIYLNNNYNLTVSMPELQVTSTSGDGINASGLPNSKLTLKEYNSSSVYKFLGSRSNLRVGSIELQDIDFWSPHTYFNATDHKMYYKSAEATATNGPATGTWFRSINYSDFTYYDLYVAGTRVSNRNSADIVNSSIKSGTVSYNSESKTLTFDGVKMEVASADDQGVRSSIPDLNIVLKGTNEMTTNATLFSLSKATTFSGSGNLEATSKEKHGISTAAGVNVTIATTNYFIVHAKGYGYWGGGGTGEKLTLKKTASDIYGYAFDGTEGVLINVPELVLDGMAISNSAWPGLYGCYFEGEEIKQNGGNRAKGYVAFKSIKERTGIYVAGQEIVRVNDASYPIYVGSPYIKSGTQSVAYSPENTTLTLNNATIDYTAASSTNDGIILTKANTELTITANGNNSLSSTTAFGGLWLNESNVTINGNGTLSLAGRTDDLYGLNSTKLNVEGDVTVEALKHGIGSNNYMGEMIVGGNAVIKAKQISYLDALTLNDGQAIVEPAGATFANKRVEVGGSLAENVVIMKVESYDLAVCDVAVNSYNASDILGDGKFVYDPSTKTLTIDNATINDTSIKDVVKNDGIDGLNVRFVGDNSFKVDENIFELSKSTNITGTGTITGELAASDGYGIWFKDDLNIVLDGATFSFKGERAVSGYSNKEVTLTVNSGKLIFEPTSTQCGIWGLAALNLGEGMMITQPEGGTYSTTLKAITEDGINEYVGPIVIEGVTAYDLAIAGKTVNSTNYNDILGNGVFSYDNATKTLTINGDYTYTDGNHVVESYVDGLTINVAGNSTIVSSSNSSIIYLCNNSTITGGKLTLMCTHPNNDGLGIYVDASSGEVLTIKDATIDITGSGFEWGITGSNHVELVIDNSDVTATAHNYGVIADWGGITLNGCYVDTPRPSIILSTGICDGGGNWVGSTEEASVVIKAGTDAINGIDATETAPADVYDVAGRRLDNVSRGINIVRTADGKVRKVLKK